MQKITPLVVFMIGAAGAGLSTIITALAPLMWLFGILTLVGALWFILQHFKIIKF